MSDIKQNFIIVSESAIIDKFTNNLYLLGIFSNINTVNVPAIHPSFTITTNFSDGEGEHFHKIIIKHEDGIESGKLEGKINFINGQDAQYIARFIGFPFTKYGVYYINVYIDDKEQPLKARIVVKKS